MKKVLFGVLCSTLLLMFAGSAIADSIAPATFTATLDVGESVTIDKTVTITKEVTSAKVDVFFMTDTTGSMSGLINSVKTSATSILSTTAGLGDVAFGVGEYKDFSDSYAYRLNTDVTTDQTAVQTGINMYSASGGGDWHEANLYALNEAAEESAWRDDSTRIMIWFGDAPGHDPSGGVTEADAIAALNAEGITVLAMNTSSLDSSGQASRIADATGGTYYPSIDTASIVDEISDAIASVFAEYTTVDLDLSDAPAGVSVSATPGYTGDYDRSEVREFDFGVTFTADVAGTYAFNINGLVDGGIVASEYDVITVKGGGAPVPEPATLMLLGVGLLGLGLSRRKK